MEVEVEVEVEWELGTGHFFFQYAFYNSHVPWHLP